MNLAADRAADAMEVLHSVETVLREMAQVELAAAINGARESLGNCYLVISGLVRESGR